MDADLAINRVMFCRSAPRDPKQPDQPSMAVKWSWPAPQFAAQLGSMSPFPDAWWNNADRLAWTLQHEQLPPMRETSPEGGCSTALPLSKSRRPASGNCLCPDDKFLRGVDSTALLEA